ncbi:mucin-2 precursor [Teratosphaeria destructans]|uniref:Mucin-2 n=1 Tax=Teratosphaeria destructans TaxID=418781 RepID=A0A9W7SZ47_9PEZI|nr:mucin-2 precursor [Teratosphaeria destructans]
MDEIYRRHLVVPPEIRGIDPAWSTCLLGLKGLYDPPEALQPVSTLAGVRTPGRPGRTGGPAAPAPTPSLDGPAITSSETSTAATSTAIASSSSAAMLGASSPIRLSILTLCAFAFARAMSWFICP